MGCRAFVSASVAASGGKGSHPTPRHRRTPYRNVMPTLLEDRDTTVRGGICYFVGSDAAARNGTNRRRNISTAGRAITRATAAAKARTTTTNGTPSRS